MTITIASDEVIGGKVGGTHFFCFLIYGTCNELT